MSLARYKQKRNFRATTEPAGGAPEKKGALKFVVQRHDATRLHYDFRLEMDGVLKSWAVPKGPSMNPADKRLAMMVEDHPYGYRTFKGIIPEGNYGAGIVEIWDEGTYECLGTPGRKAGEAELLKELKKGSVKVVLKGRKLKGEFALVKMKTADSDNAWLLLKHDDQYAVHEDYSSEAHTPKNSPINKARAGKSSPVKKKAAKPAPTAAKATLPAPEPMRGVTHTKLKTFIHPMLARETDTPFSDDGWLYEIKWDGYRAIAETGRSLRFYSRNGISFPDKYPVLAAALKDIKTRMVLDGEIVAFNEHGLPDFQLLQHYAEQPDIPLAYYVFDLLSLKGRSLENKTLLERKELLEQNLPANELVRYCGHVAGDGEAFFKEAGKKKLEGIIAKRAGSIYQEGKRSSDWLKIKHRLSDEAVILGFTAPSGTRKHFGSLVLGIYDEQEQRWIHAGKVGTGFDDATLEDLARLMKPLQRKTALLDEKELKQVTWLKPVLVAQIKYTEQTKEGKFRHPVFVGLRQDKDARAVTRQDNTKATKKPVKKAAAKKTPGTTTVKKTVQERKAAPAKTPGKNTVPKQEITHPDKLYWPRLHITKGDLIAYYESIATYILPHLKNRPQSLHRFPNGIKDKGFYQKNMDRGVPDWVKTVPLYSDSANKEINYVICNDAATLSFLNNLGCIEMNPWNSRLKTLDEPDYLVIDIDPSEGNTFGQVVDTALAVKEVLDKARVPAYCKTSGATGLHVYVPLNARFDYETARRFAEIVAYMTQELVPGFTTLERSLKKRGKKNIYIDYLQNKKGQTLAAAYSVRPVPDATVSAPLHWKEVKQGLSPEQFTMKNMPLRLAKTGDLFGPVLGKGADLLRSLRMLEK